MTLYSFYHVNDLFLFFFSEFFIIFGLLSIIIVFFNVVLFFFAFFFFFLMTFLNWIKDFFLILVSRSCISDFYASRSMVSVKSGFLVLYSRSTFSGCCIKKWENDRCGIGVIVWGYGLKLINIIWKGLGVMYEEGVGV